MMYAFPGCESLQHYLADMTLQCAYRKCEYGRFPWITRDGELSVADVREMCPDGEATPIGYVNSTDIPCAAYDGFCGGIVMKLDV